ncbi:ribosome-associated translation inhibitor RaiA [Candidatus Babeliales bacterium]|nr:ribosome-associated translation inhibitor RaiA [Candidatus Babeliales bacterium]
MKIKITFHNMEHSEPMEKHANEKLDKINELLKESELGDTPKFLELWLTAHKQHPHNKAELHLKTPQFDLHSHTEENDMYFAIDQAIDKMVKLIIKEKNKINDKNKKPETEKKDFGDDKYNL